MLERNSHFEINTIHSLSLVTLYVLVHINECIKVPDEVGSSLSCSEMRLVEPMSGFLTDALEGLRVAAAAFGGCPVSWMDWETLGRRQQDSLPFSS